MSVDKVGEEIQRLEEMMSLVIQVSSQPNDSSTNQ
jgi:hypothetical protein